MNGDASSSWRRTETPNNRFLTDEVLAAAVVDAIIELAFVHYSVNTCEQTKQTRLLLFFHSLSGFIYIFVLTQVVVAPLTASVVCLIHTPY